MLIAIDAGHGHNTAGKRCPDDSMREHDFNGSVADKVCNILNNNGIDTYRSDDVTGNTDIALSVRTKNINAKNADICVSIHANAYTGEWNNANGIETYIIAKGGEAEKIANIVQRKLIEYTGLRDRGVKVGNLHMVRETKMPAILCECGFMDNKEEAELLKSEDYRLKCAKAITDGLFEYLNMIPKKEEIKNVEEKPQGSEEDMVVWSNGSTKEDVFQLSNLTNKIGSLNPYEKCKGMKINDNCYMVLYDVDGKNYQKCGFVKYHGGIR